MKRSAKVFLCLALAWMVCIFCLSARDADESTDDSFFVSRVIGYVFVDDWSNLSSTEQQAFLEKIDHPVRKTAHATEYAILGMLWFGALDGRSRRFLLAWLISTLYAGTDEFHQLFISGRSGQFSDVCLDSFGTVVGLMIIGCAVGAKQYRQRKGERP